MFQKINQQILHLILLLLPHKIISFAPSVFSILYCFLLSFYTCRDLLICTSALSHLLNQPMLMFIVKR